MKEKFSVCVDAALSRYNKPSHPRVPKKEFENFEEVGAIELCNYEHMSVADFKARIPDADSVNVEIAVDELFGIGSVSLVFTNKVIKPNQNYDKERKQYNENMKDYKVRIKEWKEQKKIYDEQNKKDDLARKKKMLERLQLEIAKSES